MKRKESALLTKAFQVVADRATTRLLSIDPENALEIKKQQTIAVEFPRLLRGILEEAEAALKQLHN